MANDLTMRAQGARRALSVQADLMDLRDRFYRPSLIPLKRRIIPEAAELHIRNQKTDPACTGFALAAVIDQQCRHMFGPDEGIRASARMLFEMARLHDDLPDEDLAGSTLRGALKGFFHNGVCRLTELTPDIQPPLSPRWALSIERAQEARNISLGAYFRLEHVINDYHAAINEAGAIVASAKIFDGWRSPQEGRIGPANRFQGRHAFAIVGYDEEGFLVQNSWGSRWGGYLGLPGVALWPYEDWSENVEDAWVLRLAVSSPKAFDIKIARNMGKQRAPATAAASGTKPRRQDILGHYLHLDDGALVTRGRYAQLPDTVAATAALLKAGGRDTSSPPYKHLLIFTHGAMTDRYEVAARIKAWYKVFKASGIYPLHIMWETGFNSEVVDVVSDLLFKTKTRIGEGAAAEKYTDERLEQLARPLGRKLWRDLGTTARMAFEPGSDGGDAIRAYLSSAAAEPNPMQLHFASVSGGVQLLGGLLEVVEELGLSLASASLMAPACSLDHYDNAIRPHVGRTIATLNQYTLIERRERADKLDIYGKSLLYLVSAALEAEPHTPLLGLERDLRPVDATLPEAHHLIYAGRDNGRSDARTHRGFDSDPRTMNDLLETILGTAPDPALAFSEGHLSGY